MTDYLLIVIIVLMVLISVGSGMFDKKKEPPVIDLQQTEPCRYLRLNVRDNTWQGSNDTVNWFEISPEINQK